MKVHLHRDPQGRTSASVEIERAEDQEQLNKGMRLFSKVSKAVDQYIQEKNRELKAHEEREFRQKIQAQQAAKKEM